MISEKKYRIKFLAIESLYQKRFEKAIRFVYSSFLTDLKKHGLQVARSNLSNLLMDERIGNILSSLYNQAGLEGARWTYNELRVSAKEGMKAAFFGRNARWVQAVSNYLKINLFEFIAKITDTTKDDLLRLIQKGISEGWGIDKMVDEIESSEIPRARARVIARTEVVRAANVGHQIGAQSFPYEVNKKWSAAKDHRTRHSHRQVNNHVTDEDGTFRVPVYKGDKPTGQVDMMLAPGDPKAHPSNTINCRCRIIHEAKRDGKGQLIRRSTTSATVILLRTTSPVHTIPNIGIAAIRKALINAISVDVDKSE